MRRKDIVLRARVKAHHEQRVKELCEQTNMSFSDLFRALIEGAEIKLRPVPGATISVEQNKSAPKLGSTGAFAGINQ